MKSPSHPLEKRRFRVMSFTECTHFFLCMTPPLPPNNKRLQREITVISRRRSFSMLLKPVSGLGAGADSGALKHTELKGRRFNYNREEPNTKLKVGGGG